MHALHSASVRAIIIPMELIRTEHLSKEFTSRSNPLIGGARKIQALHDVDLAIAPGTTLGLVGESGSGKSTLARVILGLIEPSAGGVLYRGTDIRELLNDDSRAYRKKIQMVFQDPASTLNPKFTIFHLLKEPLAIHHIVPPREVREKAKDLLRLVEIEEDALDRYPHEFSGGQRQRIGIARALSVSPSVIILDEPVSALDLSIQTQILNLLNSLKRSLDLTYLFISHDLNVIRHMSDAVAVLYLGRVMEYASAEELFSKPAHPYTELLLASSFSVEGVRPSVDITDDISKEMPGDTPENGCVFYPRCPKRTDACLSAVPRAELSGTHYAYCTSPAR
ncbi:MAG: oligopeptide/dipeptide ABC transporter ATP-binding protein [Spirochaetota bacterium]